MQHCAPVTNPAGVVSFSFSQFGTKNSLLPWKRSRAGKQMFLMVCPCSFVSFFSFASGKFNPKQASQSFLETKLLSAFLLSLLPSLKSLCVCVSESVYV